MRTAPTNHTALRHAILQGILPFNPGQFPAEILAGVTLAALAIPEVMGYTKIAGMPMVTGLYTMLIPMVIFALLGSSRHLVVSADSATAAILAAELAGLAAAGSPQYVALAGLLAILTGLLVLLARIARLGFLADFLSRTVLIGFLTGVGIQVAIGQLAGMLGIAGNGNGTLQKLAVDLQQLPQTNVLALAIALVTLAIILTMKRITRKIPGALIAVVVMIGLSRLLGFAEMGVVVIGPVPGGLPSVAWPAVDLSWDLVQQLLPPAFSMFVVIIAQSAATSRAYAARYGERIDANADLVGLGLASIGAGLTGAFVVNGSPTKTQMVDGAGGRSQVAQLVTVLVTVLVLLFLTAPLAYLPEAVLAAIVFWIGIELTDISGMRTIWAERPVEFWVALCTAAVVVLIGVEQGILLAILLSLLVHTRHGYRAKNVVLVAGTSHLQPVPVNKAAQARPGLVVYRFGHSMYYANTDQLEEQVRALARIGPAPVAWFCIDMVAVDDLDFSAAVALRTLQAELRGQGIRLIFSHVNEFVRGELDRSGITALVGTDAYYAYLDEVVSAYESTLISSSAPVTR